jgi:hypothetical protein
VKQVADKAGAYRLVDEVAIAGVVQVNSHPAITLMVELESLYQTFFRILPPGVAELTGALGSSSSQ